MPQLTLIDMPQKHQPRNAKQRAEYEQEIAEEIASNFDMEDASNYLAQKEYRTVRVAMRLPETVSPDWLDAFNTPSSIARIARHLAKRCKYILTAA